MKHLLSITVDTVSWVLVLLILGYYCARGYARSDDRLALIRRWVYSGFLILTMVVILSKHRPALYLLVILPSVALGFLWMPSVISTMMKPLTGAFDGGDAEGDHKPFYFAAEGLRRKGKFQEAMSEVRKQLETFPGDYDGYIKLAEIQMDNLKDLPGAEATLNEFLAIGEHKPNQVVAVLHLLADWQLQHDRNPQAARETLQRVAQLFPNTSYAHAAEQRIAHLELADEVNHARHEKKFVVRMRPGNIGLGETAVVEAPTVDPHTRAGELVHQLELHPSDTDAREQLAMLYVEEFQRVDMAADQLEQLISLSTENPKRIAHWLDLLATVQIRYGRNFDAAENALRRIGERFPETAMAQVAEKRRFGLQGELEYADKAAAKPLGIYEKNIGLKM